MSLFTNVSCRLSRSQAVVLNILAVARNLGDKVPGGAVVVVFGGLATLFAGYWPRKPKYASKRSDGRVVTNYRSNNGGYRIGPKDLSFTIEWTNSGASSIHIYNDPSDIDGVAIARDVGRFQDIRDSSVFDFSSRYVTPKEGEIVVPRSTSGNYALVHIHDIRAASDKDDRDEITFSFVINPDKGADFS